MEFFDSSQIVFFFSQSFIFFFIIIFILFWTIPKKLQNIALLAFCYLFYISWSLKLLSMVLLSTIVDYFCARKIESSTNNKSKKKFLYLSILVNIGSLIVFKYFNFFIDSFNRFTSTIGIELSLPILNIILPLGISFYTFQSLAYTIDVYRGRIKPEKSFINFSIFVSYFPQLIAGPIERSANLLPQIAKPKFLKDIEVEKGIFLFVFGLFKKRVLADYFEIYIQNGYYNSNASSLEIVLGMLAFSFQAYCDVSGYTYMARGMSHLLGIKLSNNFFFPFFSKTPSDFWNRWHITLSHWLRDYIYFPLLIKYRIPTLATFVTFIFVGMWHGPTLHYIAWGILWGIVISFYHFCKIQVEKYNIKFLQNDLLSYFLMFSTILFTQAFYRSNSVPHFIDLIQSIFMNVNISIFDIEFYKFIFLAVFVLVYDFIGYFLKNKDEFFIIKMSFLKKTLFYILLFFIYKNFKNIGKLDFIYFNY